MDIRQLRYFLAISEEKTLTAAAARLHVAQPALSYQLRALEEELGVELVRRGPRSLRLTEAGELLRRRAEQLVSLADSAREEVADYGRGGSGVLSLGVISSCGRVVPSAWTARFAREHPGVRFELHEGNTYALLELLERGVVELAVVRTPFPHAGLGFRYAREEPMAAGFTPENAPACAGEKVRIQELSGRPLVFYRRFEALIGEAFAEAGAEPRVLCLNDDARTTRQWARAGLGIALAPYSALAAPGGEGLTVREVDCPALVTRLALVWVKARRLSAAAEAFAEAFA